MTSEKNSPARFEDLQRFESGSPQYERVLSLLEERITYVARKRVQEDAVQDIVQDTLLILLKKLPGLDPGKEILPYTFLVLRQVIGNFYQKQSLRRRIVQPETREPACEPFEQIDAELHFDQIMEKCRSLNGEYSRILTLVLEGYTAEEIADMIQCTSLQALYGRIHRSRNLLKKILEEVE